MIISYLRKFSETIGQEEEGINLRGLLDFDFSKRKPIPLEEVEPVENIVKRFRQVL